MRKFNVQKRNACKLKRDNRLGTTPDKQHTYQRNETARLEYYCMGGLVDVWLHPSKARRYKSVERIG